MTILNKRVLSSFILIALSILAFYYKSIMFISLILILKLIFYEFFFILKKIFKKNNYKLYFMLLLILFYLSYLFLLIWIIFVNNNLIFIKYILFIITICISSDVGGYIFGKIFKGKKLTKISPNKTFSGMYGAYLLSILSTIVIFKNVLPIIFIFLMTLLISTISQLGDLCISFLKRKAKLKDTGNIIPGHGGVLDRFDGLLFAIPIGITLLLFI